MKEQSIYGLTTCVKSFIVEKTMTHESARDASSPLDGGMPGLEEDMVKNTHGVDDQQWRTWNTEQRELFNGVYEDIINVGPALFLHPVTIQRKLSDEEFGTIAHNAAWTAAFILSGRATGEMTTIHEGRVIAVDAVPDRFGHG